MVFKIGDCVVGVRDLDTPGVVRAKYKRHYLVEFPKVREWYRFRHCTNKDLLLSDSPLIEQLKEMNEKMRKLEREADEIYEEIKQMLKTKMNMKSI